MNHNQLNLWASIHKYNVGCRNMILNSQLTMYEKSDQYKGERDTRYIFQRGVTIQ